MKSGPQGMGGGWTESDRKAKEKNGKVQPSAFNGFNIGRPFEPPVIYDKNKCANIKPDKKQVASKLLSVYEIDI